ncbi:hypothetical protein BDZ89DRAFT_1117610 [Hymenopellis radicata]|nr:hypothetical protein BDZ89DRAFT_1117610 [Hymenopellis radicata]
MLSILSKGKHKYPIMIRARRCSWLTYRASIFRPSACRLLFSETLGAHHFRPSTSSADHFCSSTSTN